jgi:hypothetical protein
MKKAQPSRAAGEALAFPRRCNRPEHSMQAKKKNNAEMLVRIVPFQIGSKSDDTWQAMKEQPKCSRGKKYLRPLDQKPLSLIASN